MFADMIHIITSNSDEGIYCDIDFDAEQTGTREDFCSRNLLHSYLRMYAVLVGDFEVDDYRTTPFIAVLFILFTLLGVIILLNVLIAIVGDSYEKSRVRSAYLFGRARVGFAAEHAALESFLMQPKNRVHLSDLSSFGHIAELLLLCGRIGRWSILLSLVATAVVVDMFLVNTIILSFRQAEQQYKPQNVGVLLFVIFILALILNFAILDIFRYLFRGCACSKSFGRTRNVAEGESLRQRITQWLSSMLNRCLGFISRKLFGIDLKQEDDEVDTTSEWEGRLGYIETQTSRIVRESERRINQKVKESEKRIQDFDRAAKVELQKDISNIFTAVVKYSDA